MRRVHMYSGVALALVAASLAAPVSSAASAPTLRVNDTQAVGMVADGFLSLSEAIALANGSLKVSALSEAERGQVRGKPGGASRDVIRIALGKGGVVSSPPAAAYTSALGRMAGNDGDTLDGGGATLAGQAPTGDGLLISSSDFTLKNLTVRGFNEGIMVEFGGRHLKNITITHVHAMPATFGPLRVGARSSNGSLKGLTVTDSNFEGGAAFTGSANVVTLAASVLAGGRSSNTLLENVLFEHNEVTGGFEGFYIYGVEADGSVADHAIVRNARVLNNYFHDSLDAAMNVDGATGVGNAVTDSGIENVEMAGNRIVAKNWGIGIWAGEAFAGGLVQRSYVRNFSIHDNTVSGAKGSTGTYCIILEAGRGDFAGVATDNIISNVRITDNQVNNCGAGGVVLHAGVPVAGSTVTGSDLRNVLVSHNKVTSALYGVVVRGALVGPSSLGQDNAVSGLWILDNTIVRAPTGLMLIAADAQQAALATGNSLTGILMRGNTFRGVGKSCVATVNVGPGAVGNTSTARCPLK